MERERRGRRGWGSAILTGEDATEEGAMGRARFRATEEGAMCPLPPCLRWGEGTGSRAPPAQEEGDGPPRDCRRWRRAPSPTRPPGGHAPDPPATLGCAAECRRAEKRGVDAGRLRWRGSPVTAWGRGRGSVGQRRRARRRGRVRRGTTSEGERERGRGRKSLRRREREEGR